MHILYTLNIQTHTYIQYNSIGVAELAIEINVIVVVVAIVLLLSFCFCFY